MKYILSGTNRKDSKTLQVCYMLQKYYQNSSQPEKVGLIDLRKEVPWSQMVGDSYDRPSDEFLKIAELIKSSEGLVIVCPEYNGGLPGALKYFIDHLPVKGLFGQKPISLVGLSSGVWGGVNPLNQLGQILNYLGAFVHPQKTYLKNIDSLLEKGDINDPFLKNLLKEQIQNFQDFTEKHSNC